MKRILVGIMLLLGGFALGTGPAAAQGGGRGPGFAPGIPAAPGPMLNPYLNLLRGGNPAANYYLGVIPEQQRRAQAAQFGGAINNQILPQIEAIEDTLTGEIVPQLGSARVPAGFGYGPPRQFGHSAPALGGRYLTMPPPLSVPPHPKPMEKLGTP